MESKNQQKKIAELRGKIDRLYESIRKDTGFSVECVNSLTAQLIDAIKERDILRTQARVLATYHLWAVDQWADKYTRPPHPEHEITAIAWEVVGRE